MSDKTLFVKQQQSSFLGASSNYIESLYETYLKAPEQLDSDWREYFEKLLAGSLQEPVHSEVRERFKLIARHQVPGVVSYTGSANPTANDKQSKVAALVNLYRWYGHHLANLDPLGLAKRLEVPKLELAYHGLTDADLDTEFDTDGFSSERMTLRQLVRSLQEVYCGNIGVEYMHISNSDEVHWIEEQLERNRKLYDLSTEHRVAILERLTAAEGLEKYLGHKFVGQKRFSLEGGDSLNPLVIEILQQAGAVGMKECVLGMAHRGRLNILVNVLGKSPQDLFDEFAGKAHKNNGYSGDVKYHMGFSSDIKTPTGRMHLALAFNPSHLEIIDPVVQGSVKARQVRRSDQDHDQVMAMLVHGDAAFAGQGVVMETFSLSQARGFHTGGTIHIIVNNQIGYTTSNPLDSRSTLYCTDVAKMVQAPVFHVNADDPEAVAFVAQLAFSYRMKFKKDIVIDMVCYRRHGHNEADEPSATQPMMYKTIKKHPTTRKLYADKLVADGVINADLPEQLVQTYRDKLDKGEQVSDVVTSEFDKKFIIDWTKYLNDSWDTPTATGVPLPQLKKYGQLLDKFPDGFNLQPQVKKLMAEREKMTAGDVPLAWGYAEIMAYASLLHDGISVRLVGQDTRRGTFAHRHAVLHDYQNGDEYAPLSQFASDRAHFTIIDSLLSEEAVLGFEYGYVTSSPDTLVIWEAQFGDFVNGAQVVIDQFISSGEQKWQRLCGLVMFLPHGFEGQGPEHSSARLERFLQLCAQHNMQVCVPSTPAQAFHMIRRQMLREYRKPLIVMTPKSLLRHKLAVSSLDDLAQGSFQLVIPEMDKQDKSKVNRVVLCSGKVYYDLLAQRREENLNNVAIVRIEQLYPFPVELLKAELASYKKAKTIVWCQEEPMNQGAWYCTQHWMQVSLASGQTLEYAGRESSASPAVGQPSLHIQQQKSLVEQALRGAK